MLEEEKYEENFNLNIDEFSERNIDKSKSCSPHRKGIIFNTIQYLKEMKKMKNQVREIDTGKGSLIILSKINENKNPGIYHKCHLKNYSLIYKKRQFLTINKFERNAEKVQQLENINNIQRNSNFNQTISNIVNSERLEKKELRLNRSENKSQSFNFNDQRMKAQRLEFLNFLDLNLNSNKKNKNNKNNKKEISIPNRRINHYSFHKMSKETNKSSLKNHRKEIQGFLEIQKTRDNQASEKSKKSKKPDFNKFNKFDIFNLLLKKVNANRICIRPLLTKIKSFQNNKKICQVYNRGEHKEEVNNILQGKLQNDISDILQKYKKPKRKKYSFNKSNLIK